MPGCFITLEGIEGSGKTTQAAALKDRLIQAGHSTVLTREPGGTEMGDRIRALLLAAHRTPMDARTECFLYLASRAQHVQEVIRPALAARQVVLCDRFTDATIVYQGCARGLPIEKLAPNLVWAADGLTPNLTFLLDLDARKGLARLSARAEINRLDRESLAFHQTVRRGYLDLARQNPERIRIVNADADPAAIGKEILNVTLSYLAPLAPNGESCVAQDCGKAR